MGEKTGNALTTRVKKAVVNAIEKASTNPNGMFAVAELGNAYAAVLAAEAQASAAGVGTKLLEEINNL